MTQIAAVPGPLGAAAILVIPYLFIGLNVASAAHNLAYQKGFRLPWKILILYGIAWPWMLKTIEKKDPGENR